MDMWRVKPGQLEPSERNDAASCLTVGEGKLYAITGFSLFIDSYDVAVFNLMLLILRISYFKGGSISWGLRGQVLKAGIHIGTVFGQLISGYLGDAFGRQFLFVKIAILHVMAVIPLICAPNRWGVGVTYWIFAWRVILGIAVGADFPIVSAIIAERARLRRRGAVLSLAYSLQGVGGLFAAAMTAIVAAAYHRNSRALNDPRNLANPAVALSISGAWRILQGLVIVPALGLLYVRLALPESTMFPSSEAAR
jgi:MFS transporter, PHS family, inorganic phosphate transporter